VIKKGKINPLEVFEIRRVSFCPSYFESANIKLRYNLRDAMVQWIEDNLSGRYYIGKTVVLNEQNSIEECIKLAFEKESELSYFMLACPHLKYN
jgi:hypothetical protein